MTSFQVHSRSRLGELVKVVFQKIWRLSTMTHFSVELEVRCEQKTQFLTLKVFAGYQHSQSLEELVQVVSKK